MSENGVWRTIHGRRVFIAEGEDIKDALQRSLSGQSSGRVNLMDKYPKLDLNQDISELDGIPAIELSDGSVIPIRTSHTPHITFIKQNEIDARDLKSGGWIERGIYEPTAQSDTMRYAEQEKIRLRAEAKRAQKRGISKL